MMIRIFLRSFCTILLGWLLVGCQVKTVMVVPSPTFDAEPVITVAVGTAHAQVTEKVQERMLTPDLIPTYISTITSSSTSAEVISLLPEKCVLPDINVPPEYNGKGCKLPVLSPDQKYLAYVTIAKKNGGDGGYFADSVKILNLDDGKAEKEIHIAHKMNVINLIEWGPNDKLIVGETIWEGPWAIFVYSPLDGSLLAKMRANGDNILNWNPQHTAFYTVRSGGYGSDSCVSELGGYDFQTRNSFPDLYEIFGMETREDDPFGISYGKTDNLYVEPFGWSLDGKRLFLTITPLMWLGDKRYEYELGPTQAGLIEGSNEGVKFITLSSDDNFNYSFTDAQDQKTISEPYKATFCP